MRARELAIETAGLAKSFGALRVLKGIDLRVPIGSVYALLGPNGAGKTTIVRILATLSRADEGESASRGSTCGETAGAFDERSASPASTTRSTIRRPLRRTCG